MKRDLIKSANEWIERADKIEAEIESLKTASTQWNLEATGVIFYVGLKENHWNNNIDITLPPDETMALLKLALNQKKSELRHLNQLIDEI